MQTLRDRLTAFCTENNKEVPYGNHLRAISNAVIEAVKQSGKYEKVKKKAEPVEVNNYPKDLIPVVDDIIHNFFTNKNQFLKTVTNSQPKTRYFNYDVETYKRSAFEGALKIMGLEIQMNFTKDNLTQYKIPISDPAKLIKLGKVFQKERNREKWELRNQERTLRFTQKTQP